MLFYSALQSFRDFLRFSEAEEVQLFLEGNYFTTFFHAESRERLEAAFSADSKRTALLLSSV